MLFVYWGRTENVEAHRSTGLCSDNQIMALAPFLIGTNVLLRRLVSALGVWGKLCHIDKVNTPLVAGISQLLMSV